MQAPVILSGAGGSRSGPCAKSKDPLHSRAIVGSAGSFYHCPASTKTGNLPLETGN